MATRHKPGLRWQLCWEIPVITNVLEMFIEVGKGMRCITRFGEEKASFPMVLTMERTVELRFPRINSKLGIAELWDAAKLEADPGTMRLERITDPRAENL